jgi:hypothetical protein
MHGLAAQSGLFTSLRWLCCTPASDHVVLAHVVVARNGWLELLFCTQHGMPPTKHQIKVQHTGMCHPHY